MILAAEAVARFHYPVVFALPIVFMALGIYLARALTRPLEPYRNERNGMRRK